MSDSRVATGEHIRVVQFYMFDAIRDLLERLISHDLSKLRPPEVKVFDEFTDKLAATTYGSDEYKMYLKAMKPALDHHYANNRHHPEFFANGIQGMNLIDILQMLIDWKADIVCHNDGNLLTSISKNQTRFGYGDELKKILLNTVNYLGY